MELALPLDQMTVEEKLRALERIWEDLRRHEADLPSPLWHGEILDARETQARTGAERFAEWEEAKRRIRDTVS